MLDIIIIGQKWFAAEALKQIIELPGVVIQAVSAPAPYDRLWQEATRMGLAIRPIHDMASLPKADMALAAHCHHYISKQIRDRFRFGVVGYHPSLLPAYPGKTAIEDAIKAGETTTGGSLFQLDDGWDTGPVLARRACRVIPGETAADLWRRALAPIGLELMTRYLKVLLADGVCNTTAESK